MQIAIKPIRLKMMLRDLSRFKMMLIFFYRVKLTKLKLKVRLLGDSLNCGATRLEAV